MTVRPGRRVDRLESQRGNHGVLRRSSVVESRGQALVIPGSDGPALEEPGGSQQHSFELSEDMPLRGPAARGPVRLPSVPAGTDGGDGGGPELRVRDRCEGLLCGPDWSLARNPVDGAVGRALLVELQHVIIPASIGGPSAHPMPSAGRVVVVSVVPWSYADASRPGAAVISTAAMEHNRHIGVAASRGWRSFFGFSGD